MGLFALVVLRFTAALCREFLAAVTAARDLQRQWSSARDPTNITGPSVCAEADGGAAGDAAGVAAGGVAGGAAGDADGDAAGVADGNAAGLPGGWVAQADPASGHTFYTNASTGQSQWHIAAEVADSGTLPGDAADSVAVTADACADVASSLESDTENSDNGCRRISGVVDGSEGPQDTMLGRAGCAAMDSMDPDIAVGRIRRPSPSTFTDSDVGDSTARVGDWRILGPPGSGSDSD
jgi:hypothetical protein